MREEISARCFVPTGFKISGACNSNVLSHARAVPAVSLNECRYIKR